MQISTDRIKELRDQTGAGILDCRNALLETAGNSEKAVQLLKEKGLLQAKKTAEKERVTAQGLVEAYIHTNGCLGAMVEVNCETDFVARLQEFKDLAHNLAMQVAALSPRFISKEEIPASADVEPEIACLLLQPFIKDPTRTIQDLVNEVIAKTGEKIRVKRFCRFALVE
ncbi:MAG: elongation factor Ts [Chloroflexota bacterium]|nr:elongation factor Ts [Chloroflexota bacterium]